MRGDAMAFGVPMGIVSELLPAVALALPRILGFHLGLPMFSSSTIPGLARNGFVASLAFFVIPAVMAQGHAAPTAGFMLVIILKELMLGFLIGFLSGMVFWAAQSAGDIISFQSGISMASFFDPALTQESTAIGTILRKWAEVLFFITGSYTLLLGSVFQTYVFWPVRTFFPTVDADLARMVWESVSATMGAAIVFAFPALIAMFLITLCMGLISRFAPSLNAFFLAMPLQAMTAAFLMSVSLPVYAYLFKREFNAFEGLFRILRTQFAS